jgi:hypothetical protein
MFNRWLNISRNEMDVLNVHSDESMGKSENRNGLPCDTYVLLNTASTKQCFSCMTIYFYLE